MRKLLLCLLLLTASAWAQYGPHPPALCGQWTYVSGNSGYMSSRSLTLYQNGTYVYQGETSSSGPYGSTAGDSSDSGTWRLEGAQIVANSRARGPLVLPLILRNHPKTGDPMIIVDGDAYVTATQRPPWPDELTD